MKKGRIHSADLTDLVEAYATAASAQGVAMEAGDYNEGNKASDLLAEIYSELRRRGPDSQNALLPLLYSGDPGTRLWAASHALEFMPSFAEPVLEDLISTGKFLGLSAKTTLKEWRLGRLRFP